MITNNKDIVLTTVKQYTTPQVIPVHNELKNYVNMSELKKVLYEYEDEEKIEVEPVSKRRKITLQEQYNK
jgi:antitoxin component of MazEF toxin-antitoxin module